MMKAVDITKFGGPDELRLVEKEIPNPGTSEVLIKVHAAGINRPDLMQRAGLYPPPAGASPILGLEVAGEVVACGLKAQRFQPGDKVCALVTGGGYAEFCVAPEETVLPTPAGYSYSEAAAIPETFFTVWSMVMMRGKLKLGDIILIHGGSSGIGTTAIQIVKALGGRVVVTCGSDEKCAACVALGADLAINYKQQDFVAVLRAQEMRPDIILDMVGGSYVARNLAVIKPEGRLLSIAFQEGAVVSLDLTPILLKRLTLTGATLRSRLLAEKADIAAAVHQHLWAMLEARSIMPYIFRSFPLGEAAQAHRLLESGQAIGKIMLTV